jgi:protein-disulfide isomerase
MLLRKKPASALLALALLLPACPREQDPAPTPGIRIDAERYRVDLSDDDFTKGGATPLVTIVVFSDFACPPCSRLWQVLDHIAEDYGDDVRIVFRSYTVAGFAGGEQAAEAAFAAGAQGKFWEMHARLFAQLEQGGGFDRPTLRAHAEAIGLDVPRFLDELDTGTQTARRARDRRVATSLGIKGLPVTFVNGLYLAGFVDEPTMHGIVDEEIKRARALVDDGVPRADLYTTLMSKASTKRVGTHEDAAALRADLAKKAADAAPPKTLIQPAGDKRYRIEPADSGIRGKPDAPVVVVAFVDFQCPFCKRAWKEELQGILDRYPDDVALAIRHLPLPIHNAATGAAKAAIAAGKQGKLWEMHDRFYAHEGTLGRSAFVAWATELGMDGDAFLAALDDPATAKIVEEDVRIANAVGVTGTPGFFVNGRHIDGYTPGVLSGVVDEEIARAKKMIAEGTPRAEVFEKTMAEAVPESEFPNK